jgi:hypothetical protein
MKMDKDFIIQCLVKSEKIYYNPIRKDWETAEEFLSGNIRRKIQECQVMLNSDPAPAPTIQESLKLALKKLKPPLPALPPRVELQEDCLKALNFGSDLTEEEQNFLIQNVIQASLGATWISDEIYTAFARWLLKSPRCRVVHSTNYEILDQSPTYEF